MSVHQWQAAQTTKCHVVASSWSTSIPPTQRPHRHPTWHWHVAHKLTAESTSFLEDYLKHVFNNKRKYENRKDSYNARTNEALVCVSRADWLSFHSRSAQSTLNPALNKWHSSTKHSQTETGCHPDTEEADTSARQADVLQESVVCTHVIDCIYFCITGLLSIYFVNFTIQYLSFHPFIHCAIIAQFRFFTQFLARS